MGKIRVLQMPAGKPTGGQTRYMLENWRFIDKSRFQFDFATFMPEQSYEWKLKEQGCMVHRFSCYPEEDMPRFCGEFNAVLDIGYDAIHLHTGYWKNFACEELAVQRNIPIIAVHAHTSQPSVERDSLSFEQALAAHYKKRREFHFGLATHFLACSPAAAVFLFGEQIPSDKIRILNNAVDINRFAFCPKTRAQYRRELGLERNFVLGHVGRFAYEKNHDFLIEVFAEVAPCLPNAVLLLVGDGKLRKEIEGKVNRLGISGRVCFFGNRADIAELYQAMDLFLLPSRFEGLGLVLIEAQAAGLRCLAGDSIPPEAKVTENLRYLPLEREKWCGAIIQAAENTGRRQDCSAQVAEAGFSIKEQIKVLERIYAGE